MEYRVQVYVLRDSVCMYSTYIHKYLCTCMYKSTIYIVDSLGKTAQT